VWLDVKVRPKKVDVCVETEGTTCTLTTFLPNLFVASVHDTVSSAETNSTLTYFYMLILDAPCGMHQSPSLPFTSPALLSLPSLPLHYT